MTCGRITWLTSEHTQSSILGVRQFKHSSQFKHILQIKLYLHPSATLCVPATTIPESTVD